ncbi:peptide chain release factor 2 [Wolbachia endosymbiont of Litomosoides brasiliensis]|uniref:peptide chain release factor 2 n=1 Tax=Wolbachia endosymbiont of Litomosoides brasiliensis TaxID=1812117 RepID=UPI00158EF86F|nr:peptide chain release factor 2 [Wolbachia endosymbiont of Litomosoides brasiliensis]
MKTYLETLEYFQNLDKSISVIRRCLDIEKLKSRLEELESQVADDNLWQDNQRAQKVLKERSKIKNDVESFSKLESDYNNAISLMKFATDENDKDFFSEVENELVKLEKLIKRKETESLFIGEADNNDCFLEIHSGAGGTESNDWAEMLMRMYTRWAEIYHNFKVKVVEKLEGDSIGIKSATIKIVGDKAYGWAKSESGIHRLVRISPFDVNSKRHTSFASIGVTPAMENLIDIAADEGDLKIDTYRASGAGGQHVNKTESAVRITHIPTGVIVQCQNSRSQHQNKNEALKLLKGRLYQIELKKKEQKMSEEYGKKCDIGWGNQIRSYVMHPYQMVRDLRTGYEVGNINSVLDGNIDCFIVSVLTNKIRN